MDVVLILITSIFNLFAVNSMSASLQHIYAKAKWTEKLPMKKFKGENSFYVWLF